MGKGNFTYTEEHKEWLINNVESFTYEELTKLFNEKFNANRKFKSLGAYCRRYLNIKRTEQKPYKPHRKYTDEHIEWVKNNIKKYTYSEMAKEFYKVFGLVVSRGAMSDLCVKKLKIQRGINTTTFKKGSNIYIKKPIGTEIKNNGYTWVKINDKYHEGKTRSREYKNNWKPKHHIIYEQVYGKIPKGHIVIFLDNNKQNFDISNLACISRSNHGIMCLNSWYYKNRKITLNRIKYLEWKEKIKHFERKIKNEQSYFNRSFS